MELSLDRKPSTPRIAAKEFRSNVASEGAAPRHYR